MSLSLESKNEKGRKVKKMSVQKVEIDINNHNLNDIRRILGLISWHNSFIEIPQSLWKYKPPFLKNKRNKEIQNTK